MASSDTDDLFNDQNSAVIDEDEADDVGQFPAGQQQLGPPSLVSTCDLPSPALSSTSMGKGADDINKDKRDKEGSWVWRWAEKRLQADKKTYRIYCLVRGCSQKKGYLVVGSSTSNILKHLKSDHKITESTKRNATNHSGSIENALSNHGKRSAAHFSVDAFEKQVCKLLVLHKLPYNIVNSNELKKLLEIAHAAPSTNDLKLPSNLTVTRRLTRAYDEYEVHLRDILAEVPMVAFTLDGWTSPFQVSFLSVTAHWIDDDWNLQDVTLGFEQITGSHTGEVLMQAFVKVVERFKLQRKVMSITSDNGSNVLKLTTEFESFTRLNSLQWGIFKASKQHIPCLAHVLNIAVQAILGKNGLGAEAAQDADALDIEDDEDEESGLERNTIAEDNGSLDDDNLLDEVEAAIEGRVEDANVPEVNTKHALQKLRKGIVKIRRSPQKLEMFKELTKSTKETRGLSPLLDVCTRWGSTFVMIERAIKCKKAYTDVLLDDNLTEFLLEEVEWRSLESLKTLLGEIDKLTVTIQASLKYATISMTVIIYNKVMDILDSYLDRNRIRHPDICRGARAAYKKLRKYYAATDKSPIYSVATALHPAMRFHYWSSQQWEQEYVNNAKQAVRTAWVDGYAPDDQNLDDDLTQPFPLWCSGSRSQIHASEIERVIFSI